MTVTPQAIEAQLDAAVSALSKTTSSYAGMVKKYGTDWTKWPSTSNWHIALTAIAAARTDVASTPPTAEFSFKEV